MVCPAALERKVASLSSMDMEAILADTRTAQRTLQAKYLQAERAAHAHLEVCIPGFPSRLEGAFLSCRLRLPL